jgi:hypothetical protein
MDSKILLNKCDVNEFEKKTLNYTLNRETHKITMNGTDYTFWEESKHQIKYCTNVPSGTDYKHLIFLQ